jgi:hypothetical protein
MIIATLIEGLLQEGDEGALSAHRSPFDHAVVRYPLPSAAGLEYAR